MVIKIVMSKYFSFELIYHFILTADTAAYIYVVPSISFQTFLVQAFKIIV